MGYNLAGISATSVRPAYLFPDQIGADEYEDDTYNVAALALTCHGSEQHITVEGTDDEVLDLLDRARAVVLGRIAAAAPQTGYWIIVEREHSEDLAVGPYPTMQAAVIALESALIDGFAEEDTTEVIALSEPGTPPEGADVVMVDLDDPHHTGSVAFTGGRPDSPVCPCGNDVECGSFLPAEADGRYMSRRQGTPEPTHLLCAECGRYWTAPDPAAQGDRDGTEPRTIPGVTYAGQIDIDALAAANAAAAD